MRVKGWEIFLWNIGNKVKDGFSSLGYIAKTMNTQETEFEVIVILP